MRVKDVDLRIIVGPVSAQDVKAVVVEKDASQGEGGGPAAGRRIVAVTCREDQTTDEHWIRRACAESLAAAEEGNVSSVALPAMGSTASGVSLAGIAKIMAQEILKFARSRQKAVKHIVVCLENDKDFGVFERVLRGYIDHVQDTLGLGPYVTVDAIIEYEDGLVLIERSNPPYGWALPGGFVDCGESLEAAVVREAKEETGLTLTRVRQMRTYSDPQRDPRFHTVSTVFVAQGNGTPRFGDDAKGLQLVKKSDLLKRDYAFDHKKIIKDYLTLWPGLIE